MKEIKTLAMAVFLLASISHFSLAADPMDCEDAIEECEEHHQGYWLAYDNECQGSHLYFSYICLERDAWAVLYQGTCNAGEHEECED